MTIPSSRNGHSRKAAHSKEDPLSWQQSFVSHPGNNI